MSLPSLEDYYFKYGTDDNYFGFHDYYVICTLCARYNKNEKYEYLNFDDCIFACCKNCIQKIDTLIVDIFSSCPHVYLGGFELTGLIKGISKGAGRIEWEEETKTFFIIKDDYLLQESPEYEIYCQMVKALCIWSKPEIKL